MRIRATIAKEVGGWGTPLETTAARIPLRYIYVVEPM
jgi:hypothetical protein